MNTARLEGEKKSSGRVHLTIIQSLTKCNALLYNVEYGAVRLVPVLEACLGDENR